MISLFCFMMSIWSFSMICIIVSKSSLNSLWFFLLGYSSLLFYLFEDMLYLLLSWSIMGFSSYAIMGKSPTYYTWKSTNSLIWLGNWSSFLCFMPYFFMYLELDQDWSMMDIFPNNMLSLSTFPLYFLGFGMKSLMYPFSFWLIYAMKGISMMSGLVHSLTMVFSGVYMLSMSWLEGWIGTEHMEMTFFPFLISSMMHLYKMFYEDHQKSMLAWSTAYSINLCHISLPWDMSFSMLYGMFHGLSKSFLFNSVQSKMDLLWSFMMGLLSGFPISLTWNMKMLFLHGKNISLYFYMWGLLGYILLYLKLSLKYTNSSIKSYLMFSYGMIWSSYSVILSMLFSM